LHHVVWIVHRPVEHFVDENSSGKGKHSEHAICQLKHFLSWHHGHKLANALFGKDGFVYMQTTYALLVDH
jgi:hypothetical protein